MQHLYVQVFVVQFSLLYVHPSGFYADEAMIQMGRFRYPKKNKTTERAFQNEKFQYSLRHVFEVSLSVTFVIILVFWTFRINAPSVESETTTSTSVSQRKFHTSCEPPTWNRACPAWIVPRINRSLHTQLFGVSVRRPFPPRYSDTTELCCPCRRCCTSRLCWASGRRWRTTSCLLGPHLGSR